MRGSVSPEYWAHFELARGRRRENLLDAMATVLRVRHAEVSCEAEVLDDDPPELSLRKGEASIIGTARSASPAIAKPFDQPHALCVCPWSGCRQLERLGPGDLRSMSVTSQQPECDR